MQEKYSVRAVSGEETGVLKNEYLYIISKMILYMNEEPVMEENNINPDDFNRFVSSLREEEKSEIEKIILRYISYEPAMVEAALHVAVDKGIISYDLKERLLEQIRMNFSKKPKAVKQAKWENSNAFTAYFETADDNDILNYIEDPADIVIDVFHAVLCEAKRRGLISSEEYEKTYQYTLKHGGQDEDILGDLIKYRYSGFTTQDLQTGGEDSEKEEEEQEQEKEYEKITAEINQFRERSGSSLLLRGGISLTIAGIMMLIAIFIYIFRKEPLDLVVVLVALGALGLGILLLWFFRQSRKNHS